MFGWTVKCRNSCHYINCMKSTFGPFSMKSTHWKINLIKNVRHYNYCAKLISVIWNVSLLNLNPYCSILCDWIIHKWILLLCSTKGHSFSKQAMKEQTNFERIFHQSFVIIYSPSGCLNLYEFLYRFLYNLFVQVFVQFLYCIKISTLSMGKKNVFLFNWSLFQSCSYNCTWLVRVG